MKRYFWYFLLSLLFNIILIALVLHFNHKSNVNAMHNSVLKVHLSKPSAKKIASVQQWFSTHYQNRVNVENSFTINKQLKGYVVSLKSNPHDRQIVYAINNGQFYFIGTLINSQGTNVSVMHAEKYVDKTTNTEIVSAVKKLHGVIQGHPSKPMITVIIDPNDNLFPEMWNSLITDVLSGEFSVKWVLINYLKPMGPNVATSILQAKNPTNALEYSATHYNAESQTGGYITLPKATASTIKTLQTNWNVVQKFNLYKLPVTIIQTKHHNYVLHGFVMDETVEALLGDD